VKDSSGHGLNGKFRYEPTRVNGDKGAAIQFDGKKDSVDFGTASAYRLTGSMTISAWIHPTSFPIDDAAIVSSRDTDELGYQLDATEDRGPRTIGFKLADPCGHLMARYGKTVLETGSWYYVAGVYDAEAMTMDVYLNGELDNGQLLGNVAGRQRSAREPLYVGKRSGANGYEFAGSIEDVRIYSAALTKEEIVSDMQGATGFSGSNKSASFVALLETSDTRCNETADPEDARIPGAVAAFGVLVTIAFIGLWPSAGPFSCALWSLALGLAFLPALSSTMPPVGFWTMPLISLAGGIAVAVSIRNRRPYLDTHSE
jgi:hypothetical protein